MKWKEEEPVETEQVSLFMLGGVVFAWTGNPAERGRYMDILDELEESGKYIATSEVHGLARFYHVEPVTAEAEPKDETPGGGRFYGIYPQMEAADDA